MSVMAALLWTGGVISAFGIKDSPRPGGGRTTP
jgi:hypothetical protein